MEGSGLQAHSSQVTCKEGEEEGELGPSGHGRPGPALSAFETMGLF